MVEGVDLNYGVPFMYGYVGMAYREDILGFQPTSILDLWRPEAQGKIALNGYFWTSTIPAVAMAMDVKPDVQELYDPEALAVVIDRLSELDVPLFYESGAEGTSAFERGDVAVGVEAIELIAPLAINNPDKFTVIIPDEGAIGWIDYYIVIRGTENKALAEAFLNVMLDPEAQAQFAEEIPYWMSNSKVEYGPNAIKFLPATEEGRAEMGVPLEWGYILEHWVEIEDEWRRKVMTQ